MKKKGQTNSLLNLRKLKEKINLVYVRTSPIMEFLTES